MKFFVVTLIVGAILACVLYPFLTLIDDRREFNFYDMWAVVMSVVFPKSHRYWQRREHQRCIENIRRLSG